MPLEFKTLQEDDNITKMISNLYPAPMDVVMEITELIKPGKWFNEIDNRLQQAQHKEKYTSVKLVHIDSNIKLMIKDQGTGFNYEKYLTVGPSRAFDPHGRGIAVAAMISFDRVEFIGSENQVHCYVNIA